MFGVTGDDVSPPEAEFPSDADILLPDACAMGPFPDDVGFGNVSIAVNMSVWLSAICCMEIFSFANSVTRRPTSF